MASKIEELFYFSDELLKRINGKRKSAAIIAFIAVAMMGLMAWLYQYSNFSMSYFYKIIIYILLLPTGYCIYSYANSAFKVICPKCGALVEQGRLPGDVMPMCCPRCKLPVLSKRSVLGDKPKL
jgi:hypothetical protein